ncbi:MAG: hypothetical protein Q4E91_11280 [Lachnospiraceae bacterium]|nr:hypothetical protein [Lachnospiraceae bacterium]
MRPVFEYRKPETNSGQLRTPVTFFQYEPVSGPEPGEVQKKELYACFCEAYNPSMKDLAIMEHNGTKEAVTVRIRDTAGEYLPTNKHFASLDDYRYSGKIFSITDVRPDLTDNRFIVILLGAVS